MAELHQKFNLMQLKLTFPWCHTTYIAGVVVPLRHPPGNGLQWKDTPVMGTLWILSFTELNRTAWQKHCLNILIGSMLVRALWFCFPRKIRFSPVSGCNECSLPLYLCFPRCWDGYVGSRCQFRDPCTTATCMNGGTCRAVTKGNTVDFSCTCRLGFTNHRCLTPINICISSPCLNGGTCELESLQAYKCHCPPGWSGNARLYYESKEVVVTQG